MKKYSQHLWASYSDIIVLAMLATLKILFLQSSMGLTRSLPILLSTSFVIIIALYSTALLVGAKWRSRLLLGLHVIVTALITADLIYYRFFNTVLSIESVVFARQARVVSNTIARAIRPTDFILLGDLVFLLLSKKMVTCKVQMPKRRWSAVLAVFLIAIMVTGIAGSVAKARGDALVLTYFGALNYHLQDILGDGDISQEQFALLLEQERQPEKDGKDDYFGIAKDKNVIVIQVESLNNFVLGRTINGEYITPNLNALSKQDSFYFDNYYQQVARGRTSDAEFVSNNSLLPVVGSTPYYKYERNQFYSFPKALKSLGYQTSVLHGYEPDFWNRDEAYPSQGIDTFLSKESFSTNNPMGWGIGDKPFLQESISYLSELEQPFYSMLITLTNHIPFEMPEEEKSLALTGTPYADTEFGDYLQTIRYTDEAIGQFIEDLKSEQLYEDSIILIYGDHYGIPLSSESSEYVSNFLGYEYDYDEFARIPFIIHMPGLNRAEVKHIAGGHADFYPTIANLMGIDVGNMFMVGQDLLNSDEGFVAGTGVFPPGSFIDNDKIFIMSSDGIYENSRAFDLITREPVNIDSCARQSERAIRLMQLSQYILDKNIVYDLMLDKDIVYGLIR